MTHPVGLPLAACTVLVTADRRSAELGSALTRRGATVTHAPALTIVPHVDDEALLSRTRELIAEPPHTAVITTGIGFRGWVEAADAAGLAEALLTALGGARIVARGPKARGALQAAGLPADWVAESETSAEILDYLLAEGVPGQRIAVQHHGAGADGVDEALAGAGADVVSLVVYRWGPPADPAAVAASVVAAAAGGSTPWRSPPPRVPSPGWPRHARPGTWRRSATAARAGRWWQPPSGRSRQGRCARSGSSRSCPSGAAWEPWCARW